MSNYFASTLDDSLGAHSWLAQVREGDLSIKCELLFFITHYTWFGLVSFRLTVSALTVADFSFHSFSPPFLTLLHPLLYIPLIRLLFTNSSGLFISFLPHNSYHALYMSSLLFLSISLLSYFLSIFLSFSTHFLSSLWLHPFLHRYTMHVWPTDRSTGRSTGRLDRQWKPVHSAVPYCHQVPYVLSASDLPTLLLLSFSCVLYFSYTFNFPFIVLSFFLSLLWITRIPFPSPFTF